MIIPESVILGARSLKGEEYEACYVPSYDGMVREKEGYDVLVDEAETAHRQLALGTNIGNLAFAWDLYATILAETLLYAAATDGVVAGNFIPRRKELLTEILRRVVKLNKSYEVLDEVFSAFMSYSTFKDCSDVWSSKIKDLEKSIVRYPNPKIPTTFKRIQKLVHRYAGSQFSRDVYGTMQGILVDAASVPMEDVNSQYDCDRRLDFFLMMAERGAENNIPILQLRQYWTNLGEKAGYRIGEWGRFDSDLVAFLTSTLSPLFIDERSFFKDAFVNLEAKYEKVVEARSEDRLKWAFRDSDNEKTKRDRMLVLNGKLPDNPFMDSSIRIVQEGTMLVLGTRFDAEPDAWGDYAFNTILRNAAVACEKQCPLNLFEGENGPLCTPIDDDRCILRKLKKILQTN
jgi:hypothetical protein